MAAAIPYIGLALSAYGTIAQSNSQQQALNSQARQQEAIAKQDVAISQIEAREERRRAELLASRLKALAGTSGTAIDSPGIQNQLAEIDERGSYNALAALYAGTTSGRTRELAALQSRRAARNTRQQGYFNVGSTIVQTGTDQGWWG